MCEELSSRLSAKGWKTIETSHQTRRMFRLLDMLFSVIVHRKKYQVAYVEVYSGQAFYWAEMVVRLLSLLHKPMILALHGGGLVEFSHQNPDRLGNFLKKGQIVVTPSLFLQVGLKPLHSAIRYLPNAVDINHHKFRFRDHPAPKIIWLRAFHEIYQPEMAVRTIAQLIKHFDSLTLTMIGPDTKDGSLDSAMKLAESLGVASHINITGPISNSEVPSWLAGGDIFLNTTRLESFGVSVMEAAACGLPIVTTSVGELAYLWSDGENAVLVPPNDSEAMAMAVERILTDTDLAMRLSVNARYNAEKYDWSVILPKWEVLFEELIQQREGERLESYERI